MRLRDALMLLDLPAWRFPPPVKRYSGAERCSRMETAPLIGNTSGETTLAGHGAMGIMRRAKTAGYQTALVYVSLGDPELHIERVRLRVAQGGHDIPDADIRRRYWRSLAHAPEALTLADEAVVLDNSGRYPIRMLLIKDGRGIWRAAALPEWVQRLGTKLG